MPSAPAAVASTFHVTDDHPWWVEGQGWLRTEELASGMTLVTQDGQSLSIDTVTLTDRVEAAFNISVADYHTYFVGEAKVWTHNCPIDPGRVTRIDPEKISAPPSKPGNVPIGNDGKPIEIHHADGADGPLVEMTQTEHRRGGNFKANHPDGHPKLTAKERKQFNKDRRQYWRDRPDD